MCSFPKEKRVTAKGWVSFLSGFFHFEAIPGSPVGRSLCGIAPFTPILLLTRHSPGFYSYKYNIYRNYYSNAPCNAASCSIGPWLLTLFNTIGKDRVPVATAGGSRAARPSRPSCAQSVRVQLGFFLFFLSFWL